MSKGFLSGWAIGHMLTSDGGAASAELAAASERARGAKREMLLNREMLDWRARAVTGVVSSRVLKMSQDKLIQALAEVAPNHPLASEKACDALFDELYEKEVEKFNADPDAYRADIVKKMG